MTPAPVLVFVSDVLWEGVWGTANHLAEQLSRHYRVLLAEMPVSVASPLRDPARLGQLRHRLRVMSDSLAVLAPLGIPPQDDPRLRGLNGKLQGRQMEAALRRIGWPLPTVVIGAYTYSRRIAARFPFALFAALLSDFPAFSDPAADPERRRLLAAADVLVATSPPIAAEGEAMGLPTLLCPQGVDYDGITAATASPEPSDLASLPHPRIGYVGTLTSRIDDALITRAARSRPDCSFVFLGARRHVFHAAAGMTFDTLPNVHMLGEKGRAELGAYLAGFDVCWVPYDWTPFNVASNPLKVMEYLAGGSPVVANAFPALKEMADVVTLVPEGGDWLAALDAALAGVSAERTAKRRAYAASNTWAARADTVADFLAEGLRRGA